MGKIRYIHIQAFYGFGIKSAWETGDTLLCQLITLTKIWFKNKLKLRTLTCTYNLDFVKCSPHHISLKMTLLCVTYRFVTVFSCRAKVTQTIKVFDFHDVSLNHQLSLKLYHADYIHRWLRGNCEIVVLIVLWVTLDQYFEFTVPELVEVDLNISNKKTCSSTGGEIWRLPTDALAPWTKEEDNAMDE